MALEPGLTILNKYRIVRLLGEGGMARVWLAEELTASRRRVAIKEPKDDVLGDDAADLQRRFQQEISLTAALIKAPHVVSAFTVEPLDGIWLLVMDYLPGGSLEDMLKQLEHAAGLPIERAVAIALDVLAALAALHGLPMEPVHRDVKPSNILFDDGGKAHLADFGLAQLPGVSGRSRLAAGAHPATPNYAAPEQLRSPEPLLPAADLFALGCVLWEMLTGQRYKRSKPGTPPSQLRADVPAWLDEVVMPALAEGAWERWQSAGDMAQALRAGQAAMQQAQQAAEAQRLAEEQAQQAAAARRAAEEQARQEAERRAQAEAAERARREEEERQRQQQLTAWFAEAKALAQQQPEQALALLAQIRSSDPSYPGLARMESRARKAQARSEKPNGPRPPYLGRVAAIVALLAVAVLMIGAGIRFIGPGGDATSTPAATIAQPVVVVSNTHTLAPPTETPEPLVATSAPPTATLPPPEAMPRPPTSTPVSPTDTPPPPTHTPIPSDTPTHVRTAAVTSTPTPSAAIISADNVTGLELVASHEVPGSFLRDIALSRDNQFLAAGTGNQETDPNNIAVWELREQLDGEMRYLFTEHTRTVAGVNFSPDGKLLASASWDGTVKLWNMESGKLLRTFVEPQIEVASVDFSPDGLKLAAGTASYYRSTSTVWIWDLETGSVLQELKGGAFMYVAAFSPTDDLIAAGGGDRKVYVWNVSDGRLLHTLPHDGQVYDLDISPDGKILATALCALSNSNLDCIRGEAWLWSLPDGELIRKLQVHSDYVESIAFSPDGSLLTTGSSDRTVKFWQMPSGELRHSVSGFHGNVIEFSPAGDIFAVGGIDTVRLYALGSN